MRKSLGLTVDAEEIRAVWLKSGRIRWRGSVPLSDYSGLSAALAQLLGTAPSSMVGAQISAVLSSEWVQLKQLQGIPDLKSHKLACQVVRENPQAFFLSKRGSGVVPEVYRDADGVIWGAGFDRGMLEELAIATRAARTMLVRALPLPVAVSTVFPRANQSWSATLDVPETVHGLAGEDARFVDAYAAAAAPSRPPLCWRPGADPDRVQMLRRIRQTGLAVAFGAAFSFAAIGPGIKAGMYAKTSRVELSSAQTVQREFERNESDLQRITQTLDRVAAFGADRGSVMRILASLSQVIPESTAMLTFHVDSIEGAFTAVAPHVTDVLPLLESVDEISAVRILGSVTPEVVGGVHVERAAFRFRRARAASARNSQASK